MAPFTAVAARLALASALAILGAVASAPRVDFPLVGIDDANIILVYARNLANGAGLVFTPGHERVEGFSTPAWMALASLAFRVHPAPERALMALCVALTGVALACVLGMVDALARAGGGGDAGAGGLRRRSRLGGALAVAWLVMIPDFYAWTTTTLMETALWTALIQAAALLLVLDATRAPSRRRVLGLAVLGVGVAWTRPEGLALAPLLALLALAAAAARGEPTAAAARRLAPALVVPLAAQTALLLARWLTFGRLLPNTFDAKVSPAPLENLRDGAAYLLGFWLAHPPGFALSLVAAARGGALAFAWLARGHRLDGREAAVLAVSCLALAGLALPLVEGGDYFGGHRFYQPFVPLLVVPLADALTRSGTATRRPRRLALAAAAILLAALTAGSWLRFAETSELAREYRIARNGRQLGRALGAAFPDEPRPRLAAIATGGLAFGYPGRVVDLMGLNWTAMARAPGPRRGLRSHAAFQPAVFWREQPEIVTPNSRLARPRSACDLHDPFADVVLDHLTASARFRRSYAAGSLVTPEGVVSGYFLRSWLRDAQPPGLVLFAPEVAFCGPTRDAPASRE